MNWNLNRAVLGLLFLLIFANATRAQTQSEHFERGKAAIASKDYNLAIAEFTLCIQLSPANSAAHYNRALAYSRLRSYELSIADYSKAIQLKPDFLSAYINRAIQYNQLGMTDPALDDYSRAIELSPRHANAYFNRGVLYKQKEQFDAALRDLDRSIEFDSKVGKVYFTRGEIHAAQANWSASVSDYYSALNLEPTQTGLYYPLTWMELHLGNNQKAYENAVRFLGGKGIDHDQSGFALVAAYLALLRAGKSIDAEGLIGRFPRKATSDDCPARILEFLRGRMKDSELIQSAKDDMRNMTQVRSSIGLKLLIDGNSTEAAKHFRWVKDNGVKSPALYTIALIELERLEQTTK